MSSSMPSEYPERVKQVLDILFYATATIFFVVLFNYYLSGEGGPTVLTVTLLPVCYILFVLESLRSGGLYERLGLVPNLVISGIYIALALVVLYYIRVNFFDIRTVRAGFWNTTDLAMGGLMVLLILEYARKRYFELFVLNILLILYAVYGYLVPGMFGHPGLSWTRIISAMSVEMTTGVYARLPQLALTLIGSFILILSVLRAFGTIDSILRGATRISRRSPYALPQAAVVGSMGVGMVSGSGAANAATIGSATIPAMVQAGMPRATAASIEASASLGGQLMPPVMGISAFLMADFLGRSYFDVVARGYVPAIIYFSSVSVAVYLLSIYHRPTRVVDMHGGKFEWTDGFNVAMFGVVVAGLVALMGVTHMAPMLAALDIFLFVAPIMFGFVIWRTWKEGNLGLKGVVAPLGRLIDSFTSMTADLTLLLATLSIMVGAFVITGIPTKVGVLMIEAAGVNLAAMALMAFIFGVLVGTGLPPSPTYILTALVIAPPMIRYGIDPWAVHFFAFFLAVWGELTPPTSVVAAVTSKIADASFMGTLGRAIILCVSLFTLMAGVLARPELVIEPGVNQFIAMYLVLVATLGVTFSLQAVFSESRATDLAIRIGLGATSIFVLLWPNDTYAGAATVPVLLAMGAWIVLRRPLYKIEPQPAQ